MIDLGSNADVDMGAGASYSKIFATPVELEAGYYRSLPVIDGVTGR